MYLREHYKLTDSLVPLLLDQAYLGPCIVVLGYAGEKLYRSITAMLADVRWYCPFSVLQTAWAYAPTPAWFNNSERRRFLLSIPDLSAKHCFTKFCSMYTDLTGLSWNVKSTYSGWLLTDYCLCLGSKTFSVRLINTSNLERCFPGGFRPSVKLYL